MKRKHKEMRLRKLKDENCRRCGLCKSSTHVCILGKGNVMASIMLIGEAPGSAEEKTGKPFMGRAGKLLDKILESMKIKNQVYISNAVRCRPPENRNPTDKELAACLFFLRKEIEIVKPEFIILLGRTAVKAFGFDSTVGPNSDYFYCGPWVNAVIKATFHPAYYLRKQHSQEGKEILQNIVKALRLAFQESNKVI